MLVYTVLFRTTIYWLVHDYFSVLVVYRNVSKNYLLIGTWFFHCVDYIKNYLEQQLVHDYFNVLVYTVLFRTTIYWLVHDYFSVLVVYRNVSKNYLLIGTWFFHCVDYIKNYLEQPLVHDYFRVLVVYRNVSKNYLLIGTWFFHCVDYIKNYLEQQLVHDYFSVLVAYSTV